MIASEPVRWRTVVPPADRTAEVPVYRREDDALFWISMFEPSLNRTLLSDGATRSWALPSTAGSYGLFADGSGAVVAVEDGLYELDFGTAALRHLHPAPYDRAQFRFNDGRCDPRGRFWVGTARKPDVGVPNGTGHFYRVERGRLSRQLDVVTIANGIAFAPDGRTMYLADRVNRRLLAYDYDPATGTASGERVFVSTLEEAVFDGAAVDRDGGYWVAVFGSGEIRRYLPDGTLDRVLEVPTSYPTMCAFGGAGLATLFVTTAATPLSEEQRTREPLAGAVLAGSVGHRGIPEPAYERAEAA